VGTWSDADKGRRYLQSLADQFALFSDRHLEFMPPERRDLYIPAQIWWNNLERIFLAIDDLGCRDLLV
jgi:hypothetical protein